MRWHVLGAGSILPRAQHGCAGYALRPAQGAPVTLFDCGPGTLRQLPAAGIALEEIERVVLSHFHPDHCLDLFALAFARRNPALGARLPELEIVGPRGLSELLERGATLFGAHGWTRFERARTTEVDPSWGSLERSGLRLAWAPTGHTPNALAWRAEDGRGASLCYSGDSGEVDALAELARGADLFVAECSFPDEAPVEQHLTPSGCARLALRAGCRRLLLTHFYPGLYPEAARERAARTFAGPIEVARDGDAFDVP
jgi:ribonuclease BN (tRNA processing enzyme)